MISELLKKIMHHNGLSQKALTEVLGVNLQRVKNLTSGKVDKLTREEADALIRRLHIRGDWLATGEGPMLQSEGEQEFYRRLDAVKSATQTASSLGLSEAKQRLVQELLFYAQAGDIEALSATLANCEILRPDQAALLDNVEHCAKEDQEAIKRMAFIAAKADKDEKESGTKKPVKKAANGD